MSSYLGDTKASALSVGYGGSTSESANEAKLTVNGGWLQIHNYGNDLKIGAQNAGWSHIEASGNIYIHAGGDLKVDNSILPYSTLTFDLGSSSLRWNTVYASNLSDGSSSKSLFTMFYMLDNGIGITSITWSALKGKRDAGLLYPGQFYRITDYVTTTTQFDTQSAGHQFDIIVFATSSNSLNENAWAIIHSGDTYFANSKLGSWELKYCLDNDTSRFGWADTTNGKGVIYHMKDEFGNECGYDFKNIMFKRYKVLASEEATNSLDGKYVGFVGNMSGIRSLEVYCYCYTFSWGDFRGTTPVISDISLYLDTPSEGYLNNFPCAFNKIGHTTVSQSSDADQQYIVQSLNNIVFIQDTSGANRRPCDNVIGSSCFNMTFYTAASNNVIGSDVRDIVADQFFERNIVDSLCSSLTFSCSINIGSISQCHIHSGSQSYVFDGDIYRNSNFASIDVYPNHAQSFVLPA